MTRLTHDTRQLTDTIGRMTLAGCETTAHQQQTAQARVTDRGDRSPPCRRWYEQEHLMLNPDPTRRSNGSEASRHPEGTRRRVEGADCSLRTIVSQIGVLGNRTRQMCPKCNRARRASERGLHPCAALQFTPYGLKPRGPLGGF